MPPGTTRPLICPWPSVGLRKPKWEALPGSSKPFRPLITQSKVCLSVEVFRRTRYRADPLAPGTFLNAVKMCFKLVCSLNLKCASAFFKGQNLAQQNQTKKKKRERENFSPIKRGMFGNLSCSHAFWNSKEKGVRPGLALRVVAVYFQSPFFGPKC